MGPVIGGITWKFKVILLLNLSKAVIMILERIKVRSIIISSFVGVGILLVMDKEKKFKNPAEIREYWRMLQLLRLLLPLLE